MVRDDPASAITCLSIPPLAFSQRLRGKSPEVIGVSAINKTGNADDFPGEVTTLLKELAQETDKVKRSEFFRQYLETMSKFWRYSYHNQLLIMSQMPRQPGSLTPL